MRGSVVGPLAMGGLWAVLGAGGALWAGAPLLAAVAAYSLCGAAGVLMGGLAAMRTEEAGRAPVRATIGPDPARGRGG